jgi:hypothetical protein
MNILRGGLNVCVSIWRKGCSVDALDCSVSLEIHVDLRFDLGKILVDILISILESLLGEFGDFTFHHALLILEKAIRSSEEAIQSDNFLEESELRVRFALFLRFDGLING